MKSINNLDKRKVILGFSGGVDSTAAALLLKGRGFEVAGVYLNVQGNSPGNESEAREIAGELGIDLVCVDVSKEFNDIVIADFCGEYRTHVGGVEPLYPECRAERPCVA